MSRPEVKWIPVSSENQNDFRVPIVMAIRDAIYGISEKNGNPLQGIQVASFHTMGSPVAIFRLIDVSPTNNNTDSSSSHDITPQLQKLLESLHEARKGEKLPWRNYIYPGDPIAYPLKGLMTDLVDGDSKYLDIKDIITQKPGMFDFLTVTVNFSSTPRW